MSAPATIRVPHLRDGSIVAKVGLALRATASLCVVFALSAIATAHGQSPCGISSVTESTKLVYPPIARAAHVEGDVVFMASFTQAGHINSVRVLSGPEMLRVSAQDFVKGWKVNPYTGPRECPIAIHFAIGKEADKPTIEITRIDPQHVRITAEMYHTFTTY